MREEREVDSRGVEDKRALALTAYATVRYVE